MHQDFPAHWSLCHSHSYPTLLWPNSHTGHFATPTVILHCSGPIPTLVTLPLPQLSYIALAQFPHWSLCHSHSYPTLLWPNSHTGHFATPTVILHCSGPIPTLVTLPLPQLSYIALASSHTGQVLAVISGEMWYWYCR